MTNNTTEAFRNAINAQETSETFIFLLTITSPNLTEDIRVCDDAYELLPTANVRGVISRSAEYIFLPFRCTLPHDEESGYAFAQLEIDNIGRQLTQPIREAGQDITAKLELVLSGSLDTPEITIANMRLENIEYDAHTVRAQLTTDYHDLEPFPKGRMDPARYPGIF
jgi:hypothetical protein